MHCGMRLVTFGRREAAAEQCGTAWMFITASLLNGLTFSLTPTRIELPTWLGSEIAANGPIASRTGLS